jgi:hypothetical protein
MKTKRSKEEKRFSKWLSNKFAMTALTFVLGLPTAVIGFGVKDYIELKEEFRQVKTDQAIDKNNLKIMHDDIKIIRKDIKELLKRR